MKWTYLPLIFILAFGYKKISQDTLKTARATPVPSRSLASAPAECMELLVQFYSEQSKEFLEKRLSNNPNLHSFFRAFPPIFYNLLSKDEFATFFKKLEKFQGAILGDLHLENFGFVIDDQGRAIFSINDLDDFTEGALYRDLLRHALSAKIVKKDFDWEPYFKAYRRGLLDESRDESSFVEKGLKDAPRRAKKTLKKYIAEEGPPRFIEFKTPYRKTTGMESQELRKGLEEIFPHIKIYDHYLRIKESGGSAGVKRFQVLAQVDADSKVRWMDIKEGTLSSYDKVFPKENPLSLKEKVKKIKRIVYANKLEELEVVSIGDHPYLLRFADQFSAGIDLARDDIAESDYLKIILDQAYAIGKKHRASLRDEEQINDYVEAWSDFDKRDVMDKLTSLQDQMEELYQGQ